MKLHILAAALVAIGLAGAPAHAAPAKKAASTKTAKKATAKKTTAKKSTTKKKTAAKKAPAAPAKPVLSDAQLALAQRVHTGKITCGGGHSITITADDKNPGYFHVASGKKSYTMNPVESRTGAMRLEDAKAGAVWLQLGSKSMLMDQKLGKRIADECTSPEQRAYAAQKQNNPAPSLFDTPANSR